MSKNQELPGAPSPGPLPGALPLDPTALRRAPGPHPSKAYALTRSRSAQSAHMVHFKISSLLSIQYVPPTFKIGSAPLPNYYDKLNQIDDYHTKLSVALRVNLYIAKFILFHFVSFYFLSFRFSLFHFVPFHPRFFFSSDEMTFGRIYFGRLESGLRLETAE